MRFVARFSNNLTNAKILKIFAQEKYERRVQCEYCNSYRVFRPETTLWRCRTCWRYFDIFTGTFLARYRTDLRFWYEIVCCFVLSKSAYATHRFLKNPRYDDVLRVFQIIRIALLEDSRERGAKQLSGTIEVDESFYGGAFKNLRKKVRQELRRRGLNKRGGGAKFRKQPVFGVFKRNGEVRLEPIPEATASVLYPIIAQKVRLDARIFSDTGAWYTGLVGLGYVHRTVDHGRQEYVQGEVHINGLEGFWGLSKTNLHIYKGIRKENWIYYLKEMEFRYNNRSLDFDQMIIKIIHILTKHSRYRYG